MRGYKTRRRSKNRRSTRRRKQKGGGCVKLEERREAIYQLKQLLKKPENIKGFHNTPRTDDKDYSELKYTIIPKGTQFLSRSAKNLLEGKEPPIYSEHPRWADYTFSLELPSYMVWDPNGKLKEYTRKLIHVYGPWLNTYETTRDIKVLHFPYNPENPHGDGSYGPYCEDQIKINACLYGWYMEQDPNPSCVDAYTMTFLPGSDVSRSPNSQAPHEFREIALRDPTSFQLVASEYAPLPTEVTRLTEEEKQEMRNVKDKNIRMQPNYREIYGRYLLEVYAKEKKGKYAREEVVKKTAQAGGGKKRNTKGQRQKGGNGNLTTRSARVMRMKKELPPPPLVSPPPPPLVSPPPSPLVSPPPPPLVSPPPSPLVSPPPTWREERRRYILENPDLEISEVDFADFYIIKGYEQDQWYEVHKPEYEGIPHYAKPHFYKRKPKELIELESELKTLYERIKYRKTEPQRSVLETLRKKPEKIFLPSPTGDYLEFMNQDDLELYQSLTKQINSKKAELGISQ